MAAKLCIDPGHGLGNKRPGIYDPGAVSGGVSEADVVLMYALTVKFVFRQKLLERGGPVLSDSLFLTRDEASDVTPVGRRDNMAENAGCTHLISLHLNAGGGTGIETICRGSEDRAFGERVHRGVVDALDLRDRGLKDESQSHVGKLAVLEFRGPACLVELGFVDQPSDREKLLRRTSRLLVAESLWEVFEAL